MIVPMNLSSKSTSVTSTILIPATVGQAAQLPVTMTFQTLGNKEFCTNCQDWDLDVTFCDGHVDLFWFDYDVTVGG